MDVQLFTLRAKDGAEVTLSNLGAGIVSVKVPDREGRMGEVCLGYENPADYMTDGPCMGKIPGRYANRIAAGRFSIDGKEYHLAVNNGPNHLHGGPTGFQNRLWKAEQTAPDSVRFTYRSADGEEGYPGNLDVEASYTWTDQHELRLNIKAVTDAPTVVNLTNHAYWNLNGHASGSALSHELWLNASQFLPTDPSLIPLGKPQDVKGTPMDFTSPHAIGRDIQEDFPALKYGKGYDNCWLIDHNNGDMGCVAAVLYAPESGRRMQVFTDQPAVQVYTGNWLDGSPKGQGEHEYHDYDGVAIECQGVPDAPNQPQFPSQRLNPGEEYKREITFVFDTIN